MDVVHILFIIATIHTEIYTMALYFFVNVRARGSRHSLLIDWNRALG